MASASAILQEPFISDSSWTSNVSPLLKVGPDSKESYYAWVNVRRAISLLKNNVKLTYEFNPLPYHFYSARIHQAFFYVLKQAGANAAEDFIAYVFSNQDNFTEEAFINKTGSEFDK